MADKQPVLIMIQGPEPGSFHKLPDNRVTTIGRSSRNTLRAVSPSVSRFHCEVACVDGSWELTDLNSRKGTIVNGERIEGRCKLKPADIIRVGATVFRFDLADEGSLQDGAMVAIMEAELDQKLMPKGEVAGSLDDIRWRSRLDGETTREDRHADRRGVRANAIFLGIVLVAVGAAVAGLLAYAHERAAAPQAEADRMEARARALVDGARAALKSGDAAGALDKLAAVDKDLSRTRAAQEVPQLRTAAVWAVAQQKLALVEQREAEGDYAGALAVHEELRKLPPDKPLEDLLARQHTYTVRLATVAFKALDQAAQQRVAGGDAKAALDAYRRAEARIGVPELVAQAQARIAALEKPKDAGQ